MMVLCSGEADKMNGVKYLTLYEYFALLNNKAKEHKKQPNMERQQGVQHRDYKRR